MSKGYSKSYQLAMVEREKGTRRKVDKEKEIRSVSKKDKK